MNEWIFFIWWLMDPKGSWAVLTPKMSSSSRIMVNPWFPSYTRGQESGFAILSCYETNSPKLTPSPADHTKPRLVRHHNSMFWWALKGGEGGWFYFLRSRYPYRVAWIQSGERERERENGNKYQCWVPRCGIARSCVLLAGPDLCG